MGRDSSKNSPDRELFRKAVEDAKPLHQDKIAPWKKKRPPRPRQQEPVSDELDGDSNHLHYSENEIETGEELQFSRPGVQKRLFQDLRRGRLEIELELDLHGLTVRAARETLLLFLRDCHRRNVRCVRIIHGKGYGSEGRQPILKQKLNFWLRQRDDVLAFCSATSRDGGTGAAYVLLRSPKKQR
jgi:DNA-nicking Smr family endonuclease